MIDLPSPNYDSRQGQKPQFIILHYTGMVSAKQALDRLTDPASQVSAHYTVDERGEIYCHVSEEDRAWHAGQSFWRGMTGLNAHSIGIEIVNPGHEFGYRRFPDIQISAVIDLCRDIMPRYEIDPEDVLGHSDIAPARKQDPGELFPWEQLAREGVAVWPDVADEDTVLSMGMNIPRALCDYGYDPRVKYAERLMAFQRRFVPEIFTPGYTPGTETSLTRARLYALLAGHLTSPPGAW
jgi:N-acetylmuramoyl-L-alanine amidase